MSRKYVKATRSETNPTTGEVETQLMVPVRVNPETLIENGMSFKTVKIGAVYVPCDYVWISENYYETHCKMLECDAKETYRSSRCRIINSKGQNVMCPEHNKCCYCSKAGRFDFDDLHDVSMDNSTSEGFENDVSFAAINFENTEVMERTYIADPLNRYIAEDTFAECKMIADMLVSKLSQKNPKYGLIFTELLKGTETPSKIATKLGLKANRTCEDVRKIRVLAQKMLPEVLAELHIDIDYLKV